MRVLRLRPRAESYWHMERRKLHIEPTQKSVDVCNQIRDGSKERITRPTIISFGLQREGSFKREILLLGSLKVYLLHNI